MPGTQIIVREAPATRSAPTATDAWFVTGFASAGPIDTAVEVRSLAEFVDTFGDRDTGSPLYDALDVFFREGGARAFVARVAGTGGTVSDDNRESAVEADWTAALERFPKDLGPGQVSAPGRTTQGAHSALLAHAESHNRVGLLDVADTATASTIATSGTAARTDANARYGALFAPWVVAPGLTAGTTRTVPASAFVAGKIALNDSTGMSPNVPSAGLAAGGASWVLDVARPAWNDADLATIEDAGVNTIQVRRGNVAVWGYRTPVDADVEPAWIEFGGARLLMAILSRADEIAERFVLRQIDGRRHLLAQFGGELSSMLLDYYNLGSLDGETPHDAYSVDVGPGVNTAESIASRRIAAVLDLRMSHMAEVVRVELVKHSTSEAL